MVSFQNIQPTNTPVDLEDVDNLSSDDDEHSDVIDRNGSPNGVIDRNGSPNDVIDRNGSPNDVIDMNGSPNDVIDQVHTSNKGTPRASSSVSNGVEDVLMSELEIEQLDMRLREAMDRLRHQQNEHEQWENSLNSRKLRCFARIKALERCHRKRMEVYETMSDYIRHNTPATEK